MIPAALTPWFILISVKVGTVPFKPGSKELFAVGPVLGSLTLPGSLLVLRAAMMFLPARFGGPVLPAIGAEDWFESNHGIPSLFRVDVQSTDALFIFGNSYSPDT